MDTPRRPSYRLRFAFAVVQILLASIIVFAAVRGEGTLLMWFAAGVAIAMAVAFLRTALALRRAEHGDGPGRLSRPPYP